MQNKSFLKLVQFFPLLGILLLFVVQNYHIYQSLQSNNELARKQIENLKSDMREDNVPSDIQGHISKVAENATFQNNLLVGSLSRMQTVYQIYILLMIFLFYIIQNKRKEPAE